MGSGKVMTEKNKILGQKAMVCPPIGKAIAKAISHKAMVCFPSPGLIGQAGALLCAVGKAIGQKAMVWPPTPPTAGPVAKAINQIWLKISAAIVKSNKIAD